MDFSLLFFIGFSVVLLGSALGVILSRSPVNAALFLVLSFFTASCLWLMLEAEFLAISLVLVYVGAVMVLFLFVVMMLNINLDRLREGFWKHLPMGVLVAFLMVVEMVTVVTSQQFVHMGEGNNLTTTVSNTQLLGTQLYTRYVYPFELAAVVLLLAIVAAIALTLRQRKDSKKLDPSAQVLVKASDRLRVVSMPAHKES